MLSIDSLFFFTLGNTAKLYFEKLKKDTIQRKIMRKMRFGARRDDAQKFKVELYIIIVTFMYRKLQLYHLCMVR